MRHRIEKSGRGSASGREVVRVKRLDKHGDALALVECLTSGLNRKERCQCAGRVRGHHRLVARVPKQVQKSANSSALDESIAGSHGMRRQIS
eukprot:scaffold41911_cov31-Tisochrysis_lutea.AAC.7